MGYDNLDIKKGRVGLSFLSTVLLFYRKVF